jgi:hypothetical protein
MRSLVKTDPLLLALDDYHLLAETEILEVMKFLIHQHPHPLRCSVSSSPEMGVLECFTCSVVNPTFQSSQGTKGNRLMLR